jgi:hypothetical protein
MEAPVAVAAPVVELSAEQQQWLGEKMQRLQSLANHLECGDAEEDGLLPQGVVPQFPLAPSAEGQAEGGDEPPADASSSPMAADNELAVGEAQDSGSGDTRA